MERQLFVKMLHQKHGQNNAGKGCGLCIITVLLLLLFGVDVRMCMCLCSEVECGVTLLFVADEKLLHENYKSDNMTPINPGSPRLIRKVYLYVLGCAARRQAGPLSACITSL